MNRICHLGMRSAWVVLLVGTLSSLARAEEAKPEKDNTEFKQASLERSERTKRV